MTTTATVPATTTSTRRLWFGADAVVTGANGLAYLAAAPLLADLLGGEVATYRWVGLFLAAFAVGVAAYARSAMRPLLGWDIVALNVVWVLGSVEVALTGALDLEPLGRGWVAAQAVVVGAFALMQARTLRRR